MTRNCCAKRVLFSVSDVMRDKQYVDFHLVTRFFCLSDTLPRG